jgi:acyl-CoA synthetase (AMP-forming)/AMP-acid ligase II
MVILPFYYVFGKSLLNTHFAVAGTVIIDNRFTFPNAVLKTMITERATSFSGVPATFSILLNRSSIAKLDFPDLRYFSQAGGHLPAAVRERLADLFPDKQIFVMYGATEASARLAFLDPSQFSGKLTSFGKAIPNVELRVISEGGDESAPNEEGEIIARGSNVMMGYWNSPEETEKVLRDAWYFTGDLGYRDHDGDFHVTGRKRDMIKVGIHKVSAREIEEVLYRHPDITEVAAFGVPDDDLGEAVKAVVVAAPEASIEETELRDFCRERLAAHKVPKTLQFASSLPRNEAGKIMRRELTTLFRDLR